ncbi:MAG: glutathione peroxidase [Solirubrobacteraceae bacterium]|nr:glutathione peroxidase [Solirubrobacteraceae bacterium]
MGFLATGRMFLRGKPKQHDAPTDLYDHRIGLLEGGELDLSAHRGRPTLFVNTASKCGFTPQFTGLQALYDEYHERGLQIVGSPSGDFAGQEHDDADAIGEVCQRNYGVTFPVTEKVSVRAEPHPLWEELARQPESGPPAWNFTKYLVDGDGRLVGRWSSKVKPDSDEIRAKIEAVLPQG